MVSALKIAISALEEIRKEQGRVCSGFELCNHKACHSSHASWEIADKALKEIEVHINGCKYTGIC